MQVGYIRKDKNKFTAGFLGCKCDKIRSNKIKNRHVPNECWFEYKSDWCDNSTLKWSDHIKRTNKDWIAEQIYDEGMNDGQHVHLQKDKWEVLSCMSSCKLSTVCHLHHNAACVNYANRCQGCIIGMIKLWHLWCTHSIWQIPMIKRKGKTRRRSWLDGIDKIFKKKEVNSLKNQKEQRHREVRIAYKHRKIQTHILKVLV